MSNNNTTTKQGAIAIAASTKLPYTPRYSDYADGVLVDFDVTETGNVLLFFEGVDLPVLVPAGRTFTFDVIVGERYIAGWQDKLVYNKQGQRVPQRQFFLVQG